MSLAANDLPIQHHATKNVQLDPFDYASARVDLNDARERKLRADALLKKFTSINTNLNTVPTPRGAMPTTHETVAREVDRRIAMVARALDGGRRGRAGARRSGQNKNNNNNSRNQNQSNSSSATPNARTPGRSTTPSGNRSSGRRNGGSRTPFARGGTPRTVLEVNDSPQQNQQQRRQHDQQKEASPVGKMLNRASRRSSVRPAELMGIRTVPKPEIPVVRQVPRRRKQPQAVPNVVDRRQRKNNNNNKAAAATSKTKRANFTGPGSLERNLVLLAASKPPQVPNLVGMETNLDRSTIDSQAQEKWLRTNSENGNNNNNARDQRTTEGLSAAGNDGNVGNAVNVGSESATTTNERMEERQNNDSQRPTVRVTASRLEQTTTTNVTTHLNTNANSNNNNNSSNDNNVGTITREISSALREHYHEAERRLVDVEHRERETAEAYRRAVLNCDHERELRTQRENELARTQEHMKDMLDAFDALRSANTSLEVTNSALVEQVDKVHGRASVAEQESLRLWRTQLKKEEIALGISDQTVRDMAENLPYEQMILDVVTNLIVENVYNQETGHLLNDKEMEHRGLSLPSIEKIVQQMAVPNKVEASQQQSSAVSIETKTNIEKVGMKIEEEDEENEDGYEDEFEAEEVEEEEENNAARQSGGPRGRIIDPTESASEDVAEEVAEEDLASDDETYVERALLRRGTTLMGRGERSRGGGGRDTTPMPMTMATTERGMETNSRLFQQLMEEKNKRELIEKELTHRLETEALNQKIALYESKITTDEKQREIEERALKAERNVQDMREQLTREERKRQEMEIKIQELSQEKSNRFTTAPAPVVPLPVPSIVRTSGSSLGALLRERGTTATAAGVTNVISVSTKTIGDEEEEEENSIELENVEGTLTDVAILPETKEDTKTTSGASVVFLQPTHMHPSAAPFHSIKKQYDDLLSDYSSSTSMDQSGLSDMTSFTDSSGPNDTSDGSSLFHDTLKGSTIANVSDVFSDDDEEEEEEESMLLNVSAIVQQQVPNRHLSRSVTGVLEGLGLSGEMLGLIMGDIEDDVARS